MKSWTKMKGLIVLVVFALSTEAAAMTQKETEVVRRVAAIYLAETPSDNHYLKPEDVLDKIYSGGDDFVLLDVRGEKDYRAWHLPKAIHIPYRQVAEPESLARLPLDKEIIVYCNSGHEESKVLAILGMLGYRAKGLKWGLLGWHYVPSTTGALQAISKGLTDDFPIEK